ncbi:MAG: hypothetical protein R3F59_33585 [Myxococcota bacterium]
MRFPQRSLAVGAWLGLLAGCSADGLTEREAHDTFDVVNTVTDDLVASTVRSVEGSGGAFSVAPSEDGLSFEGELTDGAGWTGTVHLLGAVRTYNDPMGYELLVELESVSLDGDDVVLDGEITVAFTLDYDLDGGMALDANLAIDGALDLSGSRAGHAELDYDLRLAVSGLDASFTASGQISGHDVSGWTFGLTIPYDRRSCSRLPGPGRPRWRWPSPPARARWSCTPTCSR